MTDVVVTRRIAASPATVFSFFTDRERWVLWQGVEAEIDARPGGVFRVRMPGAQVASGQFIELLAGYWLVDVESEERAIEIAARTSAAPGAGGKPTAREIQVRPVVDGRDMEP